jgi:diguanylate cyclase (GGDEF)-like protein
VNEVADPVDLEHIVIEAKLGEGVYSDVYLGRQVDRDTRVAVKVSNPPDNVDQQTMRRRFGREASILARLSHPMLPRIFEVGDLDGRPYLVMEYVEGQSLAEVLQEGPLEEAAVRRIGASLASGLAAIHGFGIIHRDLKPENVIWDREWARLVDFGLADRFESQNAEVVGTLAYSAPEQTGMLSRAVDRRADLYGLGCVLFECVTGRVPFTETEPQALMRAHVSREPPDVADLVGDVSPELAGIIRRLLEKDPSERFQTGEVLLEKFEDIGTPVRTLPSPHQGRAWQTHQADGGHLGELHSIWDEVRREGTGRVVEIEGPRGAGTSLLLERFIESADVERNALLCVTPSPGDKTPLASLKRATAHRSNDMVSGSGQFGGLGLEESSRPGEGSGPVERWSSRLVELAREAGGLLLTVDNIDSVDEPTAEVLEAVASDLTAVPILLVGTTHEPERVRERMTGIHRLTRSGDRGHRIPIAPMSEEETANYVRSYLGGELADPHLAERLHNWSGGHRVATREFLQLLLESLALVPDWGVWRVDWDRLEAGDLPEDLRGLFHERVFELTDRARALCRVGAVWGDPFPVMKAGQIAGITERDDVLAALEVAERADILEATYLPNGLEATFTHSDYREICLEELGGARLGALHGEIAQLLKDELDRDGAPELEFEAAYHMARASLDQVGPEDFGMCLRAGRWAVNDGAYREGLRLLRTAGDIAERYRLGRPAGYWFVLAKAQVQTGYIDEARHAFRQAEMLADDRMDRARYKAVSNGLLLGVTEHEKVVRSSLEVLDLLDEEPPSSRLGLLLHVIWMALWLRWAVWWDRHEPSADDVERQYLLTQTYQHYSFAAVLGERPLLGFYVNLARVKTAYSLGFSVERATAFASIAPVFALAGWPSEAWRYLEKATEDAEVLGDRYAKVRAELTHNWVAHIAGEPLKAARRQRALLQTSADELPFHERSMAYEELLTNLIFRGHMNEVLELFKHWESLRSDQPDGAGAWGRPYGLVPMAAAFLGQRDEAERCLELGKRQAEEVDSLFLRRTALQGELVAKLEWNEDIGEPLDRLIDTYREWGADPGETLFWFKSFFFYWGYVRVRQWEAARRGELERPADDCREDLGRAVRALEDAADGHPSLLSHARVLRGYFDWAHDEAESAGIMASEAERIASRIDNRWVAYEVARLRAHLSGQQGPNWSAKQALEIALEEGWVHRAEDIRKRFDIDQRGGSISQRSGSFQTGGEASRRSLDRERTLDALLRVSLATASSVDPDSVSREALRTSMEVFGAQRGILFLADNAGENLEWAMGYDAEGNTLTPEDSYSKTVVQRVRGSREPMVVTTSDQGEALGSESVLAHGIRSIMAAPLVLDDSLVGVFYLDNRMAHGVFTHGDVEVLRAIASHVPVAIETARKARLEVEVESERSRRQLAERLRSYIESINGLMDPEDILACLVEELESIDWVDRMTTATCLRNPPTILGWERRSGRFDASDFRTHAGNRERWWEDSEIWQSVASARTVNRGVSGEGSRWDGDPLLGADECHWIGIPLVADATARGIVVLEGRGGEPIDTGTLEQVLAFTSQTGVALESTWRATVDALTGVLNRGAFVERAEESFESAAQQREPLTVFVADLDNFKAINDTYGHGVGDKVLKQVAQTCNDTVRLNDLFGRHGGEEFVGILPDTREEEGRGVAERLREAVEDVVVLDGDDEINVTISLGVAGRRPADESFDDVFDRADRALYAAKDAGRNCVETPD